MKHILSENFMQISKYTIKFNSNSINLSKADLSEIRNMYVF